MEPALLKEKYGDWFVFWGGAVDVQGVLPFGKPEEVRAQVERNIRTFGEGGGFVFNNVHNIQATVPIENVVAMFDALRDNGKYPLR